MLTTDVFHEEGYLRHNKARLDHLASLNLPLENRTVLELGAGIGDHTQFFLDRGCKVTVTDGRTQNVLRMIEDHPDWNICTVDIERDPIRVEHHEVIFCYGLLYHCKNPLAALSNIIDLRPHLLLVETCVSYDRTTIRTEDATDPRCSIHGVGCRPSRKDLRGYLKGFFPHVYMPLTQPDHDEFPLDWREPKGGEARAIFIASRTEIKNKMLTKKMPMIQSRRIS